MEVHMMKKATRPSQWKSNSTVPILDVLPTKWAKSVNFLTSNSNSNSSTPSIRLMIDPHSNNPNAFADALDYSNEIISV
jgi:hypothetical protein